MPPSLGTPAGQAAGRSTSSCTGAPAHIAPTAGAFSPAVLLFCCRGSPCCWPRAERHVQCAGPELLQTRLYDIPAAGPAPRCASVGVICAVVQWSARCNLPGSPRRSAAAARRRLASVNLACTVMPCKPTCLPACRLPAFLPTRRKRQRAANASLCEQRAQPLWARQRGAVQIRAVRQGAIGRSVFLLVGTLLAELQRCARRRVLCTSQKKARKRPTGYHHPLGGLSMRICRSLLPSPGPAAGGDVLPHRPRWHGL